MVAARPTPRLVRRAAEHRPAPPVFAPPAARRPADEARPGRRSRHRCYRPRRPRTIMCPPSPSAAAVTQRCVYDPQRVEKEIYPRSDAPADCVANDRGMTTSDIVTVRGLSKSYGDRIVVDSLDLDVRAGEIVGLIGANGAGKTTTVECIQGLRRPDAGVLRVLGCNPTRDAERLRPMVGSQLQDSALPDRLRVHEAVALFATERARDPADLLERFGLSARRNSAFA